MITTANDVYRIITPLIARCRRHGCNDIAQNLDDAMSLGSSGLEILGAIRHTLLEHRDRITLLLDDDTINDIVDFVDRAYRGNE